MGGAAGRGGVYGEKGNQVGALAGVGGGGEARSRGALWEGSKQHVGPRREEGEIRYKYVEEKVESCFLINPHQILFDPRP